LVFGERANRENLGSEVKHDQHAHIVASSSYRHGLGVVGIHHDSPATAHKTDCHRGYCGHLRSGNYLLLSLAAGGIRRPFGVEIICMTAVVLGISSPE
jgi:hypothetical protein